MKNFNIRGFLNYFLILSLMITGGIGLAMIHGHISHPDPAPLNYTELKIRYQFQEQFTIPHMKKIFPLLSLFNIGVGIIILLFPLYWIWIVRYSSNLLTLDKVPMKLTVYFLILAIGHNTFYISYLAYKTIPFSIFSTMYYPHAFLEILAYILAGTFSLLCIDAIREFIKRDDCLQSLHPGELSLFILHQVWYVFILIGVLLIIAAIIECFVTPEMVYSSMMMYFQE